MCWMLCVVVVVVLGLYSTVGAQQVPPVAGGRDVANVAGGRNVANVADPEIQEMARFAVGELGDLYSLSNITNAQKQVVAGLMYHLELAIQKTASASRPSAAVKDLVCNVKVHSMSWLGYLELKEHCCTFQEKQVA